jgi:TolB-like protein
LPFIEELKRRNVFRVAVGYVITAWLLLQAVDLVLENINAPDWIMQVFMLALAVGFPLAIFFAWAYEMTPEGIKRESEVDRSQSITPQTGKKLNRVIFVVMALALGYFAYDKFVLSANREAALVEAATQSAPERRANEVLAMESGQSIAVLPFVNMSADADNEYFSDGISEELLNVLAKVSSLRVASRTSAFAYKGKELPVSEIARALQVDNVLEGSVRKAGNRVRITAQLIDGHSDKHLWSETYERQLDDIFDIQEEISNAIVDALKVALNVNDQQAVSRAQRPTENTQAYELYLQGRYLWRQRKEENIRAAIDAFKQAIAIDPGFAVAYEALASAYGSLASWSNVTSEEALQEAVPYAEQALQLDPKLSEARAIIAESYGAKFQWSKLVEQYEIALQNTPNNPTVIQWYAEIMHNLGYIDLALESALRSYEIDPASPVVNNVITYIAIAADEDELALKHWKIASELGVAETANRNVAPLFLKRGEIDRLIEMFGIEEDAVSLCLRARKDASLKPQVLSEYKEKGIGNLGPRLTAFCLAYAGDIDAAMDILEPIVMQQDWYLLNDFWNHTEEANALRQSQRFKQMLIKMGIPAYWREHGWPDLCQPVGDGDFECL